MTFKSRIWLALPIIFLLGGTPTEATQLTSYAAPIIVPAHENVDTIVSVAHPVIVKGTVSNAIVVVNQDVELAPGSVTSFVLDLGGQIHQSGEATVTEGILSVGSNQPLVTTVVLAALLSVGEYALHALFAAFLFILLIIGGMLIQRRDEAISTLIGRKYLRMFGTGIIMTLVPALIIMASILTPILWPISIILSAMYGLMGLIGLIFVANKLGRTVVKGSLVSFRIPVFMMGALAVLLLTNVPVLGLPLLIGLWMIGLGSVWTVLFHPQLILRDNI